MGGEGQRNSEEKKAERMAGGWLAWRKAWGLLG